MTGVETRQHFCAHLTVCGGLLEVGRRGEWNPIHATLDGFDVDNLHHHIVRIALVVVQGVVVYQNWNTFLKKKMEATSQVVHFKLDFF